MVEFSPSLYSMRYLVIFWSPRGLSRCAATAPSPPTVLPRGGDRRADVTGHPASQYNETQ
ncbi:hypothetical protein GCM10027294_28540 [Marinactinospora endophytica]